MWADGSLFPRGRQRPIDAEKLLGIARLRVSAAAEAYKAGDVPGAQHHVKMAEIMAAQALADHRGTHAFMINDVFMATKYCQDELGSPLEDLFDRMAAMAELETSRGALTNRQRRLIETGLASSRELVAMIEGIIRF